MVCHTIVSSMLRTLINNMVRYHMRLRQEDTYDKVLKCDKLGLFNSKINFIEVGHICENWMVKIPMPSMTRNVMYTN